MLILQELVVNFALVFDPVPQLFVLLVFHVQYYSIIMLEINEIFELLMPNFLLWSHFLESAFTLLSLSFVLSDFVILSPYLCSDLSNLAFSYMCCIFLILVLKFSTM